MSAAGRRRSNSRGGAAEEPGLPPRAPTTRSSSRGGGGGGAAAAATEQQQHQHHQQQSYLDKRLLRAYQKQLEADSASSETFLPFAPVPGQATLGDGSPRQHTKQQQRQDDKEALPPPQPPSRPSSPSSPPQRSIYDAWTQPRRVSLLALMSVATFVVPYADTVFIPSLAAIQSDLRTTQTLVAGVIAIYMFSVGATALLWGPACDRVGRRPTMLVSNAAFLGFTAGCTFAPTIAGEATKTGLRGVCC